mgnify:CR=1 FL=1
MSYCYNPTCEHEPCLDMKRRDRLTLQEGPGGSLRLAFAPESARTILARAAGQLEDMAEVLRSIALEMDSRDGH